MTAVITVDDLPEYLSVDRRERAIETAVKSNRESLTRIPARYARATVTEPGVAAWCRDLVHASHPDDQVPRIEHGPSLLLIGGTGSGKTYQAYGAIRSLVESGAYLSWTAVTAADLYAALRPRPGVDPEEVFERHAGCGLLVLDDLGAAKGSEWTEEVNYRLINHRYEHERPTLITSNVPPKNLATALGQRVASRLVEMTTRVVMSGADRRLNPGTGAA